jgi:hypothetical protein
MKLTSKEKLARLRAALLARNHPASQNLADKLASCGGEKWQGRYSCRCPACPRCRMSYIRAERATVRSVFEGAANTDLALVSVVLEGTHELDAVAEIIARGYRATRNRIAAGRRASPRWNGVHMRGWYEIDAVGEDHMPLLGDQRRDLIAEIGPQWRGHPGPIWLPTYHAVVDLGGVGLGDFRDAFQRQWSVAHQCHVQPFDTDNDVADNLDNIVGYGNKHACAVTLGGLKEPWPVRWQADLYTCLHERRSAWETLRFSVGVKTPKVYVSCSEHEGVIQPLPFVFGSITVPTYY